MEFYVRKWLGQPPMELELDTDRQIYLEGEEWVVSLRNNSDRPVMVMEGCFDTPVRLYETPVDASGRRPHPCLAGMPREPRVALVVQPHKKLDIHLRMPETPNMQLTPYVDFQRASTLWEYTEQFGMLSPEGFRGTQEAFPVCILPKG